MRHSGTNPTAAALGLLLLTEQLDETDPPSAAGFLAAMQNAEGGLRANTQIPVADLLSTFTGLVAAGAGSTPWQSTGVDVPAAWRFAESLEEPSRRLPRRLLRRRGRRGVHLLRPGDAGPAGKRGQETI